jgi:hypothetical protein
LICSAQSLIITAQCLTAYVQSVICHAQSLIWLPGQTSAQAHPANARLNDRVAYLANVTREFNFRKNSTSPEPQQ